MKPPLSLPGIIPGAATPVPLLPPANPALPLPAPVPPLPPAHKPVQAVPIATAALSDAPCPAPAGVPVFASLVLPEVATPVPPLPPAIRPGTVLSVAVRSATTPSGVPITSEYKTIADQERHFDGCVYIWTINRVWTPTGEFLDEVTFNIVYGGYEFQMSADGSRPTLKAWEAFTKNRAIQFPKAKSTCTNPRYGFGEIVGDAVNTFCKHVPITTYDPVDRLLDLLKRMLPVERDRVIFLSWCAAMVQNPGRKFSWAVVIQGTEGNGKTFLLKCLEYAVGAQNTHLPNSQDMNTRFNGYLANKLLIGVEEIHMGERRDLLDRFKPYITNDRIEIRLMHTNPYMADNLTNWFFCTNYKDAVIKSKSDRRYAVFFTAQQEAQDLIRDGMAGDYFPHLWDWARNGGFAAITGYLGRFVIPDEFNPAKNCHRAPDTSSTGEAIFESLGLYEQVLWEAIEGGVSGFTGGYISTVDADSYLYNRIGKHVSPKALAAALRNLGFQHHSRARHYSGPQLIRSTIYCNPTLIPTK